MYENVNGVLTVPFFNHVKNENANAMRQAKATKGDIVTLQRKNCNKTRTRL